MRSLHIVMAMMILGWLSGCGGVAPEHTQSVTVLIKSAHLRHHDAAFITRTPDRLRLELYASGEAIAALRINRHRVCASSWRCLSHADFNHRILGGPYDDALIYHILRREPIMGGAHRTLARHGFTQSLAQDGRYAITYRVFNDHAVFHDTINHITIEVKPL